MHQDATEMVAMVDDGGYLPDSVMALRNSAENMTNGRSSPRKKFTARQRRAGQGSSLRGTPPVPFPAGESRPRWQRRKPTFSPVFGSKNSPPSLAAAHHLLPSQHHNCLGQVWQVCPLHYKQQAPGYSSQDTRAD